LAAILLMASFPVFSASHQEAPLVGNYHFQLEIDGVKVGQFASVEGLGVEIEVVEFREGGEGGVIHKVPGLTKYGDITLKRGYTASRDLWDWIQRVIDGSYQRKNGSVILTSDNGADAVRFNFFNAWPSKYLLGLENARGNDIAIESLTITVERIERD